MDRDQNDNLNERPEREVPKHDVEGPAPSTTPNDSAADPSADIGSTDVPVGYSTPGKRGNPRKNWKRAGYRKHSRNFRLSRSARAYHQINHMRKVEKAIAEGRGQMDRFPYQPMISVRFCSLGFCTRHIDPVTRELIHALSSGESDLVRSLLWLPTHARLFSQVALPRQDTMRLATKLGIRHPHFPDRKTPLVMTTDMVHLRVTGAGRKGLFAYSVKPNPNLSERKRDLISIEAAFWAERDVPFRLFFRSQANAAVIENVRWIESFAPASPLIKARDRAAAVEQFLYPLVSEGRPLNSACSLCDAALGLERGTALTHVRMFIHARAWTVKLTVKISTFSPLTIKTRNHIFYDQK